MWSGHEWKPDTWQIPRKYARRKCPLSPGSADQWSGCLGLGAGRADGCVQGADYGGSFRDADSAPLRNSTLRPRSALPRERKGNRLSSRLLPRTGRADEGLHSHCCDQGPDTRDSCEPKPPRGLREGPQFQGQDPWGLHAISTEKQFARTMQLLRAATQQSWPAEIQTTEQTCPCTDQRAVTSGRATFILPGSQPQSS